MPEAKLMGVCTGHARLRKRIVSLTLVLFLSLDSRSLSLSCCLLSLSLSLSLSLVHSCCLSIDTMSLSLALLLLYSLHLRFKLHTLPTWPQFWPSQPPQRSLCWLQPCNAVCTDLYLHWQHDIGARGVMGERELLWHKLCATLLHVCTAQAMYTDLAYS